ncbi:carbohydrate ABC transporter permease [Promicromonospora thailandica]|uniref:Multiple sugar transport system permease protein n=1 Tax=Promicromonospora thailandica TaxID=765201 RepID=A0A9X2JX59_9MICO|nr:carbohydrate ABC transporter permease [Promicromonospora thailandica]MCP2265863.1 multiple sugar transport system permease protein [Promicromonospora thailandica]BFF21576.1 carbohydrate ABC transporter permease [Promicromonospora thailandica]
MSTVTTTRQTTGRGGTPRARGTAPGGRRRPVVDGVALPGPFERTVKAVVLTVACALVVLPFVGIVSTSLATPEQVTEAGGFVLLPTGIDLSAYRMIFAGGVVTQALWVSVVVTSVGTALSLALTTTLGWALSRRGAFGVRAMLLVVLVSLLFNPGIIPSYLVVQRLGLLDTLWALIVPTSVSAFNVVVVRAFFVRLPAEILDAARIDGASEWQLFRRIGLPLSKPVLAVVGLFYGVGYWNAFFNALLYLSDASRWPLQLVLRTYVVDGAQLGSQDLGIDAASLPPQTSLQMAILVVSVVPVLLVYPFLQRHFAQGMLTGAVKG